MKTCIKLITIASLTIAAILNTNNIKAQAPYITPNPLQVNMYEGESRSEMFHVYNGIVEQLQSMNETDDPVVRMRFEEYYQGSSSFRATFYAIAGVGATHLATFVIKATLRGLPGVGIAIVVVELLIAVLVAQLSVAPLLHLPMLALMTERLTIKKENATLKCGATDILGNLVIA